MAYINLKSGYCTGKDPGSTSSNDGGLRMYWELRLYTSDETPTIGGRTYYCPAGSYRLYHKLQGWYGVQISGNIRLVNRIGQTAAAYVALRNGTTDIWVMGTQGLDYANRNPSFGNNNPPNTWYDVADAENSDYHIFPEGILAVSEGQTLSLNLTYYVGLYYNNSLCVNASATSTATAVPVNGGKFTLSISQGSNTTVTVTRGATPLSNGATIYTNDSLTFTYSVGTGYNIATHTVNGTTQSSGYSWIVASDASVVTTATLKSYNFSASPSSHGQIRVRRTAGQAPLNTDLTPGTDKLYYNDTIQVIFSIQDSAYEIISCTLNGSLISAEESLNIIPSADDFTYAFAMTEQVKRWTLTVTKNNYTNNIHYVINRTSSPSGLGTITTVDNGDLIYYNDVLELNWQCDLGYSADCKVNSTKIQEAQLPYQWTVTSSPKLYLYGNIAEYILTRTATSCTVTVNRTSSNVSGAPTGLISDSEKIYYGDVLNITVIPDSGRQLSIFTINNVDVSNPCNNYTVTTATSIIAVCTSSGTGYIKIGNSWVKGQVHILINGAWQPCQGYILENGQWVQCQ